MQCTTPPLTVLAVSNPFLDRIAHVSALPEGLESVVFDKTIVDQFWVKAYGTGAYPWSLGGSGTTVITVLTRLLSFLQVQHSSSLLGMVGKDRADELKERFENLGITPLLTKGTSDNGIVNCFVTPDSERTMQTYFGASFEFSPDYLLSQHFKVSHVHLEGYLAYFKGVLEKSVHLAKEQGATLSLDLSSIDVITKFNAEMKACAAKVDVIFGNFQEMAAFTGYHDPAEMMKHFDSKQFVVITDGSRGGWIKSKNELTALKFDAEPVEKVVDTTGAGDCFTAGILAGLLAKKDIQTTLKIATLVASLVIQQDGTELSQGRWDALKAQIRR